MQNSANTIKLGLGLYRHMLTPQNFAFARQCGCTHLVVHLANYYKQQIVAATNQHSNYGTALKNDPIWEKDNLLALQKMAREYGLEIYAIENFSPADWYDVLLDGPKRAQQMEYLKQIIRNTGAAGIPAFGYNFSFAGVWGHSKKQAARGGAKSTCFNAAEIDTSAPIPAGQIWNMTYDDTLTGWQPLITKAELWNRLERFLQEMLPVAEQAGVELALHPDDPPMETLRQTPRLVYQPGYYQKVIDLVKSPANKLDFCMGSIQEMAEGDIYSAIEQYAKQQKISYVHFRNVRGKVPHYDEVFVDEGDIDMLRALALLQKHGFNGVIVPDHTPEPDCDAPWHAGMAFALGYMQAALQMLQKGLGSSLL
ncbi:mannonate dehydratase [Ruminococcaceae bacterium OttesenSCG-928-A16]|nr:mannonate dehydratase [Ruminococcaceae bacterium OttesenSCG-928-A16]